jgi:hypothetical protein
MLEGLQSTRTTEPSMTIQISSQPFFFNFGDSRFVLLATKKTRKSEEN